MKSSARGEIHHYNVEESVCGRTLLTIVARGSAIITELHRLVELVPAPFNGRQHLVGPPVAHDSGAKRNISPLDSLICDFSYFKDADRFEAKIEADEILKRADEEFCDTYVDLLTRFYLTFESIQRYSADLNRFIRDLEEEAFVGQSLDSLLLDTESRQLLCEAYFLLGHMLLTTDQNFEGGLRERLIVSHYRYSSYKSAPDSSLDDTCNLMRSTGFKCSHQQVYKSAPPNSCSRPDAYPESFFARVGVNQSFVNLLIAKLQSVDIYNQTLTAFPHPDHRSTALGQQASMLYVILYFCPNILGSQRSRMREITDKFFNDNWIISIGMGELVNLIEVWEPYKAARESLVLLLETETTRNLVNQYNLRFFRVSKQLQDYLREGWLNEESILEQHSRILNQIREANVVLRWILLHSQMNPNWRLKLTATVYALVTENQPSRKLLYNLLQDLAELERQFSSLYEKILCEKKDRIRANKAKAIETLNELVEIFNDTKPMRWIEKGGNFKLASLLTELVANLETIEPSEQADSRDATISLINQLETSQESYSDGRNLQVIQLFMETKNSLLRILRSLSLTDEMKIVLSSISDFSYAWKIMDSTFTNHMQQIIKDNPMRVYGIGSTFLKLASAFDTNLIRIQQVNSHDDLVSVSQYYSTKLVAYIRDVLHIIPATILELVSSIISIQTENVFGNMPSSVSLDTLKDYLLPEKRFQMLELTYKISHYAESLLMVQDNTIGLIRINSKQLLEDGIRRELVKRMSDSIQEILQFGSNESLSGSVGTAQALMDRLMQLDAVMSGYKSSFEYIQDYLFIYGLRMWQEELSRVIKFNVEQATEALINENSAGYQRWSLEQQQQQSIYQSLKAPIPIYGTDPLRSSFILRILNELLVITDPKSTIYDEQMSAWYEQAGQTREKVADLRLFELVLSSLGATGLNGIDQMCCTLLMLELHKLDTYMMSLVASKSFQAQGLVEALACLGQLRDQTVAGSDREQSLGGRQAANAKTYSAALIKIAPFSERIINHLLRIGQLQAIRTNISCVLSTKSRYEARNLYNCLETLNTSFLATLSHGKSGGNVSPNQQLVTTTTTATNAIKSSTSLEAINAADGGESGNNSVDNLEDSQLIFELTNHLEWVGLSDPMSKIYTLALQASSNAQVFEFRERLIAMDLMFFIMLDQSSKFYFSRSISGFVPKKSRTFYDTTYTVDGQPLFYGLTTLINHYQPFLPAPVSVAAGEPRQPVAKPLNRLLERMSLYVKISLVDQPANSSLRPQDLTLELANMILSMIELVRLARQSPRELLTETFLPEFILDTFQYTICHLGLVKSQ